MTPPHLLRYLTPAESSPNVAPAGFNLVDEPITRGMPHRTRLDGVFSLVLVAPTGVATAWRDADPAEIISKAADERVARVIPGVGGAPAPLPVGTIARHPVRLLVLRNGVFLGSLPLTAGLRRSLPEAHETIGAGIELIVLDWNLTAGVVRGPGDFGARLTLAWRTL